MAEYKLPLIDGRLIVEEGVAFSDVTFPVTVEVAYTFGSGASGSATVKFTKYGNSVFEKVLPIESGSGTFEVNIVEDLKVNAGNFDYFEVQLTFEDPLTETKVTDTKYVNIQPYVYNILTESDLFIKPGSPFKFTVSVVRFNGKPAPAGTKIQVDPIDSPGIPSQTLIVNENGKVESSVNIPTTATNVQLKISTAEAYDMYIYAGIENPINNDQSYLRIDLLTKQ